MVCLYGDSHARNRECVSHYTQHEKDFNLRVIKGYSEISVWITRREEGSRRICVPFESAKGSERAAC